jgi:hypothetical protein
MAGKNFSFNSPPTLLPNFPIKIDSGYTHVTPPLLADFDNDGTLEIVITIGVTAHFPRAIYIFNKDGNQLHGWPIQLPPPGAKFTAAGDIQGDGKIELVVVSESLYVFNSNGTRYEGFPVPITLGTERAGLLSLYDLDNDNRLEIILLRGSQLLVFNADGQMRNGWPQVLRNSPITIPKFTIGNIGGNDNAEIVVAATSECPVPGTCDSMAALYAFGDNGVLLPGWPAYLDSNYFFWGFCEPVIIPSSPEGPLIAITNNRVTQIGPAFEILARMSIFSPSGQVIRQWRLDKNDDAGASSISVADIDGNGELELITATDTREVIISSLSGTILQRNMYGYVNGPDNVVVGKLTSSDTLTIIARNNQSSNDTSQIFFYQFDGSSVPWSPIKVRGIPNYVPALGDINNDGSIDMVTITTTITDLNYLYAWTLPGISSTQENFPWPMYGHDRYRTSQFGFVPSDSIVSVPSFEQTTLQFSLSQNYPNPFNPQTTLSFVIRHSSLVSLKVYNTLGKEVAMVIQNELKEAGEHKVTFDASNVPSGIYYYRLTAGTFTETKKFVVVR